MLKAHNSNSMEKYSTKRKRCSARSPETPRVNNTNIGLLEFPNIDQGNIDWLINKKIAG